jgi:hypothetical protein
MELHIQESLSRNSFNLSSKVQQFGKRRNTHDLCPAASPLPSALAWSDLARRGCYHHVASGAIMVDQAIVPETPMSVDYLGSSDLKDFSVRIYHCRVGYHSELAGRASPYLLCLRFLMSNVEGLKMSNVEGLKIPILRAEGLK